MNIFYMIFPVQFFININTQVFTAPNLFNVIITQLMESEVSLCFLSPGFPKTLYKVLSTHKLCLSAENYLLSAARLLFALAITSSSDFPCTKTQTFVLPTFALQSGTSNDAATDVMHVINPAARAATL